MKRQTILVLVVVVSMATENTWADPYIITDLGTLGGDNSMAMGINILGHVVGQSEALDGQQRPFFWDGTMRELNTIGFTSGGAQSINDTGQIVGTASDQPSNTRTAFLWANGSRTPLDNINYQRATAYDINNRGQVVGEVLDDGGDHQAVLWENGNVTKLGDFNLGYSYARGINYSGQIVGTAYSSSDDGVAFLWEDGHMTDLGSLLDGDKSKSAAHNISNSGQVVGHSATAINSNGEPSVYHAFLWEDGIMSDLGVLDGHDISYADGINDVGQIVGYSVGSGWNPSAVLWDTEGNIFDLNESLSPSSGWNLIYAFDINNNGQIVGYGNINGQYHGYLLTPDGGSPPIDPIPIPGAIVLGSIGITFSGWLLRKRRML